ncbi:ATPase [Pedobacter antarcticus 4BY]|uniref:ATPase n=2 Tax=Pedobacter antarcticus TaxID=34086 RepID=A0A081PKP0_9SPHI|nr:ATP-binding protein [Pedobacter antarcticus]KEQ31263.1 ATPase [Pedobacter antarcticus 4BY]SFE56806.1 ATPase family associated with various cellular activities (AAA) [Pedobacter antarcticus]
MNIFDLIIFDKEQTKLDDIFLNRENRKSVELLIKEYSYIEELHQYGLPVNNKLLLHGSSGCGKTTTAKAIANALGKPLLILNLSNVICSRIGETSQNIKQVFDKAAREKAVLFLDEFDQIGKARDHQDKDVGEMRRLVNTLIQLIDYFPERSLLIGATNHLAIIDIALLRRFQLTIGFEMPTRSVLDIYYDKLLERFPEHMQIIQRKYDVSYAEAKDDAFTQVKAALITNLELKNKC